MKVASSEARRNVIEELVDWLIDWVVAFVVRVDDDIELALSVSVWVDSRSNFSRKDKKAQTLSCINTFSWDWRSRNLHKSSFIDIFIGCCSDKIVIVVKRAHRGLCCWCRCCSSCRRCCRGCCCRCCCKFLSQWKSSYEKNWENFHISADSL